MKPGLGQFINAEMGNFLTFYDRTILSFFSKP